MHGVHAADQDLPDEVLGRDQGEVAIEREDDKDVDAGGGDQLGLPFHRGEQPRFAPRREHLAGMPVERDRDRPHAPLIRAPDHRSQYRLMT